MKNTATSLVLLGVFAAEIIFPKNLSFAESVKSIMDTVEGDNNKSDNNVFNSGCAKNSRNVGNEEIKENKIGSSVKENNKIIKARGSNNIVVMARHSGTLVVPASVVGIAASLFSVLLEKLKRKKETSKDNSESNTSEYDATCGEYPNTNTINKLEPKEQESSVKKVMRITLWLFFGVLLFPLIFIAVVALIRGGNGVRSLLLRLKLNKLWLVLDALVAKFRYNWSLFPNSIFSNIPILYWYAGNCFLNAAFYMFAAPEYFWLFKKISEMDIKNFIEQVDNATLNREKWSKYRNFWNSLDDNGKKNEAKRIIEIAKTCITFLNFVAGENENINEYKMKGKFSVVGKFNTWQFNEDEGSYKAKENEIFTIKTKKEKKLRNDDYYGGSIEDAFYHLGVEGCYKNNDCLPYFELLEDVMSNEEDKKTVVEYEELLNVDSINLNSKNFGEIIKDSHKKYINGGKVLVSICFAKNGLVFTVQPKYKYNEITKKIELACWLVLDCHGRSHKVLHSYKELYDFLEINRYDNPYLLRYTDLNSITKDNITKKYYLIENKNHELAL